MVCAASTTSTRPVDPPMDEWLGIKVGPLEACWATEEMPAVMRWRGDDDDHGSAFSNDSSDFESEGYGSGSGPSPWNTAPASAVGISRGARRPDEAPPKRARSGGPLHARKKQAAAEPGASEGNAVHSSCQSLPVSEESRQSQAAPMQGNAPPEFQFLIKLPVDARAGTRYQVKVPGVGSAIVTMPRHARPGQDIRVNVVVHAQPGRQTTTDPPQLSERQLRAWLRGWEQGPRTPTPPLGISGEEQRQGASLRPTSPNRPRAAHSAGVGSGEDGKSSAEPVIPTFPWLGSEQAYAWQPAEP